MVGVADKIVRAGTSVQVWPIWQKCNNNISQDLKIQFYNIQYVSQYFD